jgi:transposase InsO family protein
MSKARLVITAIVIEGRTVAEVIAAYGVSKSWTYELLARYRVEGEAAFEPRSRRPKTNPTAISERTVELIIKLRQQLAEVGLDAGPDTIAWHLEHHHQTKISIATVSRTLTRQGLVTPEPKKRPKSSYIRFQADLPNETWQSDFTHYRLTRANNTPGPDTEIITWLDDHARYALHVSAHTRITGPIVLATFRETAGQHGYPAAVLTDNGLVYTTRFSGGRGGRNGLESELRRLDIAQKNTRPNHPTTTGKVERFQQTMKKWLTAQPTQPATLEDLQALIDTFADEYNQRRPHRSLPHRATPATAYQARPKATPSTDRSNDIHYRVLHDIVDKDGKLSLRMNGQLHHIGIGVEHRRTPVIKLVEDHHVRIINAATGELLRELTIDPTRDYQPLGRPPGPRPRQNRRPDPSPGSGLSGIS